MYQIKDTDTFYRTDPWNKPYDVRVSWLKEAKAKGRHTVAYLYPVFDSSTFRYRGYNVVETLEYSSRWTGSYFELKDIKKLIDDLNSVDVLVLIRCAWDFDIERLIQKAKEKGIKICYDVDDLIYHSRYMPYIIHALGLQKSVWNYWFGLTVRNGKVLEMCDATITTNDFLAKYLSADYPDKKCYVLKNYLNWIQEEASEEYFRQKIKQNTKDEFIIGYFSGSPTHVKDLVSVLPEIEEFMKEHSEVILEIVGYMDLPEKYDYLRKRKKIRFVPFQTFVGLQREQAKVDINIVPLVNNEFSNCKSELKYFETAIVGTPTCATPSFTYSSAIENGENGYLCEKGEWLRAFEKLYKQKNDVGFKQRIHDIALKDYAGINQLDYLEKMLESILELKYTQGEC